jgi:hypothetical protein
VVCVMGIVSLPLFRRPSSDGRCRLQGHSVDAQKFFFPRPSGLYLGQALHGRAAGEQPGLQAVAPA